MVDPQLFFDAVRAGDVIAVNAMIADGVDVNSADASGNSPLHAAIEHQSIEIVGRLVDSGAFLDAAHDQDWTPLEHAIDVESDAAWQRHHEIGHESIALTKLLLEAGAVPTERAIALAQDYENQKALALLIEYARDSRSRRST